MEYQVGQKVQYRSHSGNWKDCVVLSDLVAGGTTRYWHIKPTGEGAAGFVTKYEIRPISPLVELAKAAE